MRASELAALVGGRLVGPEAEFVGVAPLETAGPEHASFALEATRGVRAGVLLAREPVEGCVTVVVEDPRLAFIRLLDALFPERHPSGVQAGAFVDPTARVAPDATVYPGAYVGPEAEIGAGAVIFPNAVVMARSLVGAGCRVGPGAVVGHAGFGVHATASGLVPIPQVGRAVLERGVALGANTCVDRAFLDETRVGEGTQVDNLVQVGHNVRIGADCVLVAQVGISGSSTLERGVVLGGQAGIADHVRVGAGARVGAQSGVARDLPGGQRYLGTPAAPARDAARVWAASRELPEILRRLARLERQVADLLKERGDKAPKLG